MRKAREDTSTPRVDIRSYLVMESWTSQTSRADPARDGTTADTADPQFPALFVYALNIVSKAVVSQFANEASVDPKKADPVGVVTAQIFASKDFHWGERPLIDILIAKYHVACPVLFGVSQASEATDEGKTRLGWTRIDKDGPFIPEQLHGERMTGLGAGFASIALRNFRKSSMQNPYPNWHYWQAVQWIIRVPSEHATATHYTVLKAMVQHNEARIIEFFGNAALASLKDALVNFPRRFRAGPRPPPAASAVTVLPDLLRREQKLTLVQ